VIDTAREAAPSARFSAILDCADDAGAAQGALYAGIDTVVFTGRPDVAARLSGIAATKAAHVLTARPTPTLDLIADFFADTATLQQLCAHAMRASRDSRSDAGD
jgi:hypothetical protein